MNDWQSTHLGRGAFPRDLSGFEIEAFFTYSESERRVIDDERRSSALKLALALCTVGVAHCLSSRIWRVPCLDFTMLPKHSDARWSGRSKARLLSEIVEASDPDLLVQWRKTITQPREDGATVQSWLWAAPAKHWLERGIDETNACRFGIQQYR